MRVINRHVTPRTLNHQRDRTDVISLPKAYTVHSWIVKERKDGEFAAAWQELAKWIIEQPGSTESTRLFRDMHEPRHFMSVDSWDDERVLRELRNGPEYNRRTENLRSFIDHYASWPLRLEAEKRVSE